MPKYNRDFLVPYLQDVCALHLLHRKLLVHRRDLENQVAVLQRGKQYARIFPARSRLSQRGGSSPF